MSSSSKSAGYDQEEKYFHDLNNKLIERQREQSSKALQIKQTAQIIPFPTGQKDPLKKAG